MTTAKSGVLSLVVKEAYASYSELLGITATDRVSLVKNGNTTAISVDGRLVAQGSTFVALNVYTGFSIGFQDATSEEVTQVLRALTYTVNHYGTADRYGRPESTRSIEISIVDGGSRTAKATILVDKQPIAPVGQTLTGTAASDKIVGAFGNDKLSASSPMTSSPATRARTSSSSIRNRERRTSTRSPTSASPTISSILRIPSSTPSAKSPECSRRPRFGSARRRTTPPTASSTTRDRRPVR